MNKPPVIPYGQPGFLAAYGAVWSSGDSALLGTYFSEDGCYVESSYNDRYEGREQIGRFSRFMHAFSRDVRIKYLSHCGDASLFTLEWLWSGVATGPTRIDGIVYPASHKPYEIAGAAVCRATAPTTPAGPAAPGSGVEAAPAASCKRRYARAFSRGVSYVGRS